MARTDGKLWDALEAHWRSEFGERFARTNKALAAAVRLGRPQSPEEAEALVRSAAEEIVAVGLPWREAFVRSSVRTHFVAMLATACEVSATFAQASPCSEAWQSDLVRETFPELEALLVRRLDWMNAERVTDVWQRWEYEETPAQRWTQRQAKVAFEQMRRGLLRGDSYAEVIDAIEHALGVRDDSPYTELVVRTNMASALGQGRVDAIAAIAEPGDVVVYQAIHDDRTRPEHLALDGRVFEAGSDLHFTYAPPLGYQCRCTMRWYSAATAKRRGLLDRIERQPVRIGGVEYLGDPGFETKRQPTWKVTPKVISTGGE